MSKSKILLVSISLILLAGFGGCRNLDELPEIGEPRDFVTNIGGTFQVDQLIITEGANTLDVSSFAIEGNPLSTFSLSISSDGTYTLTSGPVPFPANEGSGTWVFDNDEAPSQITFNDNAENTVALVAPLISTSSNLSVQWEPSCNGVIYDAVFNRQNAQQ